MFLDISDVLSPEASTSAEFSRPSTTRVAVTPGEA
jgi:hypothetical protein